MSLTRVERTTLGDNRIYLWTFPLPKQRKNVERWDVMEYRYVQEEYWLSVEEKKDEDLPPGKNMQVGYD